LIGFLEKDKKFGEYSWPFTHLSKFNHRKEFCDVFQINKNEKKNQLHGMNKWQKNYYNIMYIIYQNI